MPFTKVRMAMQFQRRRVFFKLTNQEQEFPIGAMFVNELEGTEQS